MWRVKGGGWRGSPHRYVVCLPSESAIPAPRVPWRSAGRCRQCRRVASFRAVPHPARFLGPLADDVRRVEELKLLLGLASGGRQAAEEAQRRAREELGPEAVAERRRQQRKKKDAGAGKVRGGRSTLPGGFALKIPFCTGHGLGPGRPFNLSGQALGHRTVTRCPPVLCPLASTGGRAAAGRRS